jgi:D-sedoheptulose 7-phosphate isomerase
MNNVKQIINKSRDFQSYAKGYLQYISDLLKCIDIGAITLFIEELEKARKNQNTVFIIGNGGSAVTATHMANDFGIGFSAGNDRNPYRVLSLTDNTAKMTAISNDYGYDKLFFYQLKVHYMPGDKLVAISASGNSPNIVAASEWVKKRGGRVIGLVGFDGGKLKNLSDIFIHIKTPKGEYGPVEDMHMIVNHLVYTWLCHKDGKGKKQWRIKNAG